MKLIDLLFEDKIPQELKEEEDYRGGHKAPDKTDAPLYDVTLNGIYPEDFYSVNGARYYGDGSSGDSSVVLLIQSYRNKPDRKIKIYRAVPMQSSLEEQIDELKAQKKYILKTNKLPKDINTPLSSSEYYQYIHKVIERLEQRIADGEQAEIKDIKDINPGDWVTIYRPYAVGHGKGVLNNKYKILSKNVKASELFTDGNSVYEWGYNP